jgi:hypothetical protein
MSQNEAAPPVGPSRPSSPAIRLGEELPIFCEKCGYALHGLPQAVCERCAIRHFHCPECGHHQPINTLRPAFQKVLGRVRAWFVACVVLLKINAFGWAFVAWLAFGYDMSYRYRYEDYMVRSSGGNVYRPVTHGPRIELQVMRFEGLISLAIAGFFAGAIGRMLLMRWRRGYLVGMTMAGIVVAMLLIGAFWRANSRHFDPPPPSPISWTLFSWVVVTGLAVVAGATLIWPIWVAMVSVFLPKRTGQSLLEWQRAQSDRAVGALARE